MYSIISFSIAACKSLRAPSCSSCSKNGFSASSARFSTEITLFSLTGVSFLFGTSGEAAEGLFFLLKGCAFSHLFIHNFRLYLAVFADGAVHDRVKKSLWLPSTAVEELVIGAPVLMLTVIKADGARDGATSQAAEQAQG